MTSPEPPFVRDRRFVVDLLLCAVVTVGTVTPVVLQSRGALETGAALLVTLPLLIRRQLPALALVAMTAGALSVVTLAASVSLAGVVAVPILIYTLARWSSDRLARLGLTAGVVGSLLGPARWYLPGGGLTGLSLFGLGVLACFAVVTVAYVLGRRRRETLASAQQQQVAELERVRLVQAEQLQRDHAAAVAERNRIARELHDIVAHSLSVIVVQAEGGRALAVRQPDQAAAVLGTIAETGREALGEMRRIVGVLRTGGDAAADYLPAPGLDDLPELVGRTSDRAELSVFGTPPATGPALELSAYRLVQESLTNVLKHAGPEARSRVSVAYTATAIEIEVSDDGRGGTAEPAADGAGHGLDGMAERAALHGGEVSAQPGQTGGWVVRARLPYDVPDPAGSDWSTTTQVLSS